MANNAGKSRKRLGNVGEVLAVAYLEKNGYIIHERNYRADSAEIDIICEDKETRELVFVEVKARTSTSHGSPVESVTPRKLELVMRAAQYYIHEEVQEERSCRIDVIGIQFNAGVPSIEHLKDVVEY